MEDNVKLFEQLYDNSDAKVSRDAVVAYIKSTIDKFEIFSEETMSAAYALAGLMATNYINELDDDDPVLRVLTIAGELEVAPPNARQLATELAYAIRAL